MQNAAITVAIAYFLIAITAIAGWITNVFWLVTTGMDATSVTPQLVLSAVGVFLAPVGAIHGVCLWF